MDLVIKAVDLICYSWYKYCLGPAPDLMSLTDWCFVMDQVSGLRMLRSWGEPSASAPLRWRDQDHEHSENCQLPEPPPSVILWIRNEDIWIINVIQSPGLLLLVGLLSLVRNVAASSLYWERRGDTVKTDILGASLTRQTEASLARCTDSIYITLSQGIQSPEIYNPSHIFRWATATKWQNIIPNRESKNESWK